MAQVLVIDADEWVAEMVVEAIRAAGHDVIACATARDGFDLACATEPDCIVCDMRLPDHDGTWVAKSVRAEDTDVRVVPFVFFTRSDDIETGVEGFQMGADVIIQKPFRLDELMAQIDALLKMSRRLRETRSQFAGKPEEVVIEGDLAQANVPTLLAVLELEQRSGSFFVEHEGKKAEVQMASGLVAEATINGKRVKALDAVAFMIGCPEAGRFKVQSGKDRKPPGGAKSPRELVAQLTKKPGAPKNAPRPAASSAPAIPPPRSTSPSRPAIHPRPPRPPTPSHPPTRGRPAIPSTPGDDQPPSSVETIEVEADLDSYRPPTKT